MAKYKCKMCGAPLDVKEGQTVVTCQFCQSTQTVANADDERKENLFKEVGGGVSVALAVAIRKEVGGTLVPVHEVGV